MKRSETVNVVSSHRLFPIPALIRVIKLLLSCIFPLSSPTKPQKEPFFKSFSYVHFFTAVPLTVDRKT